MLHRPNGMDSEFLNKLGSSIYLTDDYAAPFSMAAKVSSPSGYFNLGPDVVEPSIACIIHGLEVTESTGASTDIIHGPDASKWNG